MTGAANHPEPDPAVDHELYQMQASPDHFRQGVGTALFGAVVEHWRAEGAQAARVWVWEFNTRGRAFYAACGWVADGRIEPDQSPIGDYQSLGYRFDL